MLFEMKKFTLKIVILKKNDKRCPLCFRIERVSRALKKKNSDRIPIKFHRIIIVLSEAFKKLSKFHAAPLRDGVLRMESTN